MRKQTRRNELLTPVRLTDDDFVEALREAAGVSKTTARAIAEAFPQANGLENTSIEMLESLGATRSQAKRIRAAFNLTRMCDRACQERGMAIRQPEDVVAAVQQAIAHRDREYFVAILLDARQQVIDIYGVGVGSLAEVSVHPREVMRKAVQIGAHSVIIAHNHPSGSPEPSTADLDITERLANSGRILGVPVLDSIIVTPSGHVSLAERGFISR